ncbi:HWE histidine kinase domain-containing protein [Rhizobium sp. FY34]|uniref:sensor histidine kinase n=1 Tax=Rhizobium sp. FY34 TaxID=2562309 RepID=UPI001FEDEAF2|nr:HWE histidine kinase domain-containing protein [Rhizobium sp. FY34]
MASLIRGFDWSKTTLGAVETWPACVKFTTAMLLQSPVPIVTLWGEAGVMIYNDAYSAFAGFRHPQLLGANVREGWPEVADFNDHVMKVGLAGNTLAYSDQELTLYRKGTPEQVWMDLYYSPVPDETGKAAGVIAMVVETTERVRAEKHQKMLINELNHRVKNTLASIQAIVSQTLRGVDTKEEASAAISQRIMALSRAHDVLTDENWDGADLHTMAQYALDAFQPAGREAISIEGPKIRVGPHAALSIALALHELATNASKYGALSTRTGTVAISWSIEPSQTDDDEVFKLSWEEQGGPLVRQPDRRGFGTRLILGVLPQELRGTAEIDYQPQGLRFVLRSSRVAVSDTPLVAQGG